MVLRKAKILRSSYLEARRIYYDNKELILNIVSVQHSELEYIAGWNITNKYLQDKKNESLGRGVEIIEKNGKRLNLLNKRMKSVSPLVGGLLGKVFKVESASYITQDIRPKAIY